MYLYDVQLMLTAWAMTFLCSLLVLETFYFDTISSHSKLKHIFIICYMPLDSSASKLLYSSSCPSQATFPSFPSTSPPLLHLSKKARIELSTLTAIYSAH